MVVLERLLKTLAITERLFLDHFNRKKVKRKFNDLRKIHRSFKLIQKQNKNNSALEVDHREIAFS